MGLKGMGILPSVVQTLILTLNLFGGYITKYCSDSDYNLEFGGGVICPMTLVMYPPQQESKVPVRKHTFLGEGWGYIGNLQFVTFVYHVPIV